MKRERISIKVKGRPALERVAFDRQETIHSDRWSEEAWVRYRGGRLFVRRETQPNGPGRSWGPWGPWLPYRVEPKKGNAYEI